MITQLWGINWICAITGLHKLFYTPSKTQISVAEEISEKYGVHITENDIREITQSYGFSHHIKDNNKKPAFIRFPSALYKKIHKAWEKDSLQNE